jgi:DNA polymerase-3 subunit alpha
MNLFDDVVGAEDASPVFDDRLPIPPLEFDKSERLRAEKEMLGLYVSDHPLMGAEPVLRRHIECTIAEAADLDDGSMRNLAGVVTGLQRKYTKRGDLMATFVLEDLAAAIEVMVFPKTMLQYGELLEPDAIVVLKARIDAREDTPKLIAMEISRPEINIDGAASLTLRVRAPVLTEQRVAKLRDLLRSHPGESPVFVRVVGPERETVLRLGDEFRCDARNGLYAELRVLFGADCIV